MTTILALFDTPLKDGKFHWELKKLVETADLVLYAGGFKSQETYNAMHNECKGKLRAVCGDSDGHLNLRDSNGNPLQRYDKFELNIKFYCNGELKKLSIYLANQAYGSKIPESAAMDMAETEDVDLVVFGRYNRPLILWGKKQENSKKSRLLVCPGSNSYYDSSHTAVLLKIIGGKFSEAKIVRIAPQLPKVSSLVPGLQLGEKQMS